MKMKSSALMLTALVLTSCGKNAYLNKSLESADKALRSVTTENKLEDVSNDVEISIATKDLNLGNILQSTTKLVPIIIENDGKDIIDQIKLISGDGSVAVKEVGEIALANGGRVLGYIEITEDQLGEFLKEIEVEYKNGEESKTQRVNITGVVTEDNSIVGSTLKLTREQDDKLNFRSLPVNSNFSKEVILKNVGNTSSIVTAISIEDGTQFSIDEKTMNECIGDVLENCSVITHFNPKEVGKFSDKVKVTYMDNNGISNDIFIKLRGKATDQDRCVEINEVAHMPKTISELGEDELNMELPYFEKISSNSRVIEKLLNDQENMRAVTLEETSLYVSDAQVVTSFNIESKRVEGTISGVELTADMKKYVSKNDRAYHEKTEILCIENTKACSGVRFISKNYKQHINPAFSMDSDIFSKNLLENGTEMEEANIPFLKYSTTMKMKDVFPNSYKSIYDKLKIDASAMIILSDDIKLEDSPQLNIKYKNIKDKFNKCI